MKTTTVLVTSSLLLPSPSPPHQILLVTITITSASLHHPVSSSISIMTSSFSLFSSPPLLSSLPSFPLFSPSLLFKTGFCYVVQACLELVNSQPPSPELPFSGDNGKETWGLCSSPQYIQEGKDSSLKGGLGNCLKTVFYF